jgi:hypothetical protein
MSEGGMRKVVERTEQEVGMCSRLAEIDEWLLTLRETIRDGGLVSA